MNEYPIIYLNSNDGSGIIAFGEGAVFLKQEGESIQAMQDFIDTHTGEYVFGHLGYDLKNYPVTYDNFSREISLPVFYNLTDEQTQTVINAVINSVNKVLC